MEELANKLQEFVMDLEDGKKPMLIIEAPPQHGKSEAITDIISWVAGRNPSLKTIFASFSERLGVRANLKLQRLYSKKVYQDIFPNTKINEKKVMRNVSFLRNREILEYIDEVGYFRNTTVQGSITGESLDLGVIDDPLKGREAANSVTTRNKTWEWFTDDFFTRFSEDAGFLMILTRWHIDDPAARLIENNSRVKVLKYKALAEIDEKYRQSGEALIPEHKSKEFLLERKSIMGVSNFQALYQQSPIVSGGGMIKTEWWKFYKIAPEFSQVIIFADTAQKTKEHNDYSVFEACGKSGSDIYLIDAIRGKWEAPELLQIARSFYHKIRPSHMVVEDKSSGTGLIQQLSRELAVLPKQRNTDKISRCMDTAPWVESGHVYLP